MKHEKSCGAICYTREEGAPRVLVICHRYGGHWAFPKGHVEAGESEEETAMREVREETGAQVRVRPGYREVTTYSPAKGVTKDVVFFVAEITGGTLRAQPEEVRAVCLLPLEEAQRRLTQGRYREARALLEEWGEAGAASTEKALEGIRSAMTEEELEIYDPLEAYRQLVDWLE